MHAMHYNSPNGNSAPPGPPGPPGPPQGYPPAQGGYSSVPPGQPPPGAYPSPPAPSPPQPPPYQRPSMPPPAVGGRYNDPSLSSQSPGGGKSLFGIRKALAGDPTQLKQTMQKFGIGGSGSGISREQLIASAFQDALREGCEFATTEGSREGGFGNDREICIEWPQEIATVREALTSVGMREEVREMEVGMNRAAEMAAQSARDIFVTAVMQLTLHRATDMIRSPEPEACTSYLRETCYWDMDRAMAPIVNQSLDRCKVASLWDKFVGIFNKLPLVRPIQFDLKKWCVGRSIRGLLRLCARKERGIRADPMQAASDAVKQVFKAGFWGASQVGSLGRGPEVLSRGGGGAETETVWSDPPPMPGGGN